MKQKPSAPSEKRSSEVEFIPPGQEQTQPKVSDIYVSVWTSQRFDEQSGRQVRTILFSALFGLALAVAFVFVALALTVNPLLGVLIPVAMFAVIRHAQFRRLRTALARGKRA
jgi:Flp pilus assembly protein TadB